MQPHTRQDARTALGWQEQGFHVVAVGRIAPVKRFSLLIEACIAAHRPMTVTILGAGDAAPLHQQLQNAGAKHIELQTCCTDNDVAIYLSAADLYVSSSLNESFGLANVEAQACGTPAICTAVGGVADATAGGVWLMPGTAAALTVGIQTLYDDALFRKKWSVLGRSSVAQLPSPAIVAARYECIYRSNSQAIQEQAPPRA